MNPIVERLLPDKCTRFKVKMAKRHSNDPNVRLESRPGGFILLKKTYRTVPHKMAVPPTAAARRFSLRPVTGGGAIVTVHLEF